MSKDEFYCRTKARRRELILKYEISPLAHLKLVRGQKKRSAACDDITDQYYCFTYKNKTDEEDTGSFFCGVFVANDFLEILNLKPLPIFNPFKSYVKNREKKLADTENLISKIIRNTLAKEAYAVINILIMVWNFVPYGKLEKILNDILKYPESEPFLWKIKEINRIVGLDYSKRTLNEMNDELCTMDDRIKKYQFPEMVKILSKENVKIYI